MSVTIYYEQDADLAVLKGKKVAILGYGSQGRAHALNLHDSGVEVTVGLRPGGTSWKRAEEDGLDVATCADASKDADVIAFLLPDPEQPKVYREAVEPTLSGKQTLLFAHGFNVHYNQITPPDNVDVVMIAPKGPGNLVRQLYVETQGIPSLLAIAQDATGQAKQTALAYGHALGSTRAGIIETSFKEETETDLFGEQAILCGGVTSLMKAGFETLVEAGYAPEMAYFECIHEMKLIVDLIYNGGLEHMRLFVSDTAKFGDVTRGPRVIDDRVKDAMKDILEEIQNGKFATEWVLENQAGRPVYNALLNREQEHPTKAVGASLRKMMGWLKEDTAKQKEVIHVGRPR